MLVNVACVLFVLEWRVGVATTYTGQTNATTSNAAPDHTLHAGNLNLSRWTTTIHKIATILQKNKEIVINLRAQDTSRGQSTTSGVATTARTIGGEQYGMESMVAAINANTKGTNTILTGNSKQNVEAEKESRSKTVTTPKVTKVSNAEKSEANAAGVRTVSKTGKNPSTITWNVNNSIKLTIIGGSTRKTDVKTEQSKVTVESNRKMQQSTVSARIITKMTKAHTKDETAGTNATQGEEQAKRRFFDDNNFMKIPLRKHAPNNQRKLSPEQAPMEVRFRADPRPVIEPSLLMKRARAIRGEAAIPDPITGPAIPRPVGMPGIPRPVGGLAIPRQFPVPRNVGPPAMPRPVGQEQAQKKSERLSKFRQLLFKNKAMLRKYISFKQRTRTGARRPTSVGVVRHFLHAITRMPPMPPDNEETFQMAIEITATTVPTTVTPVTEELVPDMPKMMIMNPMKHPLRQLAVTNDKYLPNGDELDMAPARGIIMSQLRSKGRVCQRQVLIPEGPKYDSAGKVYWKQYSPRAGQDFAKTTFPTFLLPRCCNCCKKSVLGCE